MVQARVVGAGKLAVVEVVLQDLVYTEALKITLKAYNKVLVVLLLAQGILKGFRVRQTLHRFHISSLGRQKSTLIVALGIIID